MRRRVPLFLLPLLVLGCGGDDLPDELPFDLTRPKKGEALTDAEIRAFTERLVAFYRRTDYFDWLVSLSHGMHASTGKPDYLVWWQDIEAIKEGDVVTFRHAETGGGHNVYIATSRILQQASAAYLLTGDSTIGTLVEQYSKGIVASCKGMVFDDNDPNPYLMARNIVNQNHTYEVSGGRKKAVDYSGWYSAYEQWNAQRIHFPNNPYWGDVWVTNMRSKDDVPHIYSAAAYLRYVMERGEDADVRTAAAEAYEYISGFAKDIVDNGYRIRTKDAQGEPWIPDEDLASFVQYESIVPNGECTAKLTSALLGAGDPGGNDCGLADGNDYEALAVAGHYYNYAIVDHFHLSAILTSLLYERHEAALRMLRGLGRRVERYQDPEADEPGWDNERWEGDVAVLLLEASAAGLPLTAEETRLIHAQYGRALDAYEAWPNWDLWSLPDGTYPRRGGYEPEDEAVPVEDLAYFFAYCFSPFANETSAPLVDCDLLSDPERW